MKAEIEWKRTADEVPDDDMTVLVALSDGEVWTGYCDAGWWRYVSGDRIEPKVVFWAEFPEPPCV